VVSDRLFTATVASFFIEAQQHDHSPDIAARLTQIEIHLDHTRKRLDSDGR
jgi:hypothetical protein